MAKAPPDAPAAKIALYDKVIATQKGIERKGAANAYTSYNGNMFSFMHKSGKLALRLSADEREAFMKKYRTKLAVAHNTVMKEYVSVPDSLLKKTAELKKYFSLSVKYVKSLKAKPTTRKAT
jgi:TfoX/Sxy family transcriptional regulator of competence genes